MPPPRPSRSVCRGTDVLVTDAPTPDHLLQGAVVYRLQNDEIVVRLPLTNPQAVAFRTAINGYLQGRGRIAISDTLFALLPVSLPLTMTEYFSGAVRSFVTSSRPITTGLDGHLVTIPGVQTLTVTAQNPLLLFDLSVALQRDVRTDEEYQRQLEHDLESAPSELLFSWSHGQAALGTPPSMTMHRGTAMHPVLNPGRTPYSYLRHQPSTPEFQPGRCHQRCVDGTRRERPDYLYRQARSISAPRGIALARPVLTWRRTGHVRWPTNWATTSSSWTTTTWGWMTRAC